jgi:hypothetical protein
VLNIHLRDVCPSVAVIDGSRGRPVSVTQQCVCRRKPEKLRGVIRIGVLSNRTWAFRTVTTCKTEDGHT